MSALTFELLVARDVVGSHIDIKINSEPDRLIARVVTILDAFVLADDRLRAPSTHFERSFAQAGTAGPGTAHTLEVQVYDDGGGTEAATKLWQDEI